MPSSHTSNSVVLSGNFDQSDTNPLPGHTDLAIIWQNFPRINLIRFSLQMVNRKFTVRISHGRCWTSGGQEFLPVSGAAGKQTFQRDRPRFVILGTDVHNRKGSWKSLCGKWSCWFSEILYARMFPGWVPGLWPSWPHRTPQTPKQLKTQKSDSKVTFGGHPKVTPKVTQKWLLGHFWVTFGSL